MFAVVRGRDATALGAPRGSPDPWGYLTAPRGRGVLLLPLRSPILPSPGLWWTAVLPRSLRSTSASWRPTPAHPQACACLCTCPNTPHTRTHAHSLRVGHVPRNPPACKPATARPHAQHGAGPLRSRNERFQAVTNGPKWLQTVSSGCNWSQVVTNGFKQATTWADRPQLRACACPPCVSMQHSHRCSWSG